MLMSVAVMLTACGDDETNQSGTAGSPHFTVHGYMYDAAIDKKDIYVRYQEKWAKKAKETVNATIEWVGGDLSMMMAAGEYPDIILKTAFQNVDVAKYASQGIFIDLTPYISEENTPNIWKMFTDHPTTKAIATSPDGGIYALPSYSGNPGEAIETCWWINDSWLKKLNLETPTNLDELYEVLKAFKTKDPNDSTRIATLQTDIFAWVEKNKADWIMGRSNVDADWDAYIAQFKNLSIDEYVEINQKAYDVFQRTLDEATK